jgi:outer membrane protein assembly factor BamB
MAAELMPHCTNKARTLRPVGKCILLGALLCGISTLLTGPAWGKAGDILWQKEIDRAHDSDQANAIAAEGNRVYVAVAGPAYLVQAYDGETGGLLWQDQLFDVPNFTSFANAIAADNGRVYVAGRLQGDLLVRAYDGKTGYLLWQGLFDLAGLDDFAQAITIEKGHVYVGGIGTLRRARPGDPGSTAFLVVAFDADDGRTLWQNSSEPTGEPQINAVTSITAKKGRVYAAGHHNDDSLVRAYDGDTGTLLWQDQEHAAGFTAIGVEKGRVYASGFRNIGLVGFFFVRAYDGRTGTLLWQDSFTLAGVEFSGSAAISISGGRVYAVGGSTSGINPGTGVTTDFLVRAYDGDTGVLLWQDNFHGAGFRGNAALAVDSGGPAASSRGHERRKAVYVAGVTTSAPHDTQFVVRAYESETGALLWKDEISRPGQNAALEVVVENDRVYAAGRLINITDTTGNLFIRAYDAGCSAHTRDHTDPASAASTGRDGIILSR